MKIHNDLSGKCWIPPYPPYIKKGFWEDVPRRLYIHTKFGMLTVGSRTVAWLPVLGAMPWKRWYWWWFITWLPKNRKPGLLVRRYPHWYGMK